MSTSEGAVTAAGAGGRARGSSELGFGNVVSSQRNLRLINRDGSFNVHRRGLGLVESLSLFHALVTMSWSRFMLLTSVAYLVLNGAFAVVYMWIGQDALSGPSVASPAGDFARAFFFSVQTASTIGYGQIAPSGLAANLVVTLESYVGLLGFAVATGLLFARLSRPTARIVFSDKAIIAPYRGGSGFMFRIVNGRSSQLIEVEVKLSMSRMEVIDGEPQRRFYALDLELGKVAFFALSWTIVHPIDDRSPLSGETTETLCASHAEFHILLTGIDETFGQTVHTRSSYSGDEVVHGARFLRMYDPPSPGQPVTIDIAKLSAFETVAIDPPATVSGD